MNVTLPAVDMKAAASAIPQQRTLNQPFDDRHYVPPEPTLSPEELEEQTRLDMQLP